MVAQLNAVALPIVALPGMTKQENEKVSTNKKKKKKEQSKQRSGEDDK